MCDIYSFKGILPPAEKAAEVTAVPYDVVNTEEAAEMAKGNPLSFLRVSRPEIELGSDVDIHDEKVYAKAAENYARLKKEGPLLMDDAPRLYVYSLLMGNHRQTGIVAAVSVDDYDKDIVKKHEKTRKDKEDDRTRHILSTRSHTGPVFLTYRDTKSIDSVVKATMRQPSHMDFTAPGGVRHTLWKLDPAISVKVEALFKKVPCLYIADGHHRAASASRVRTELRAKNPQHTGKEEYNRFLAVIFPSSQLRILPYNRLVKDLNGLSAEAFMKAVSENFEVTPRAQPSPDDIGEISMYLGGQWLGLRYKGKVAEFDVIDRLDVSVLQNKLLAPVIGIDDPRTSQRIDFVGGIRGTAELEKKVDSGAAAVAFSMYPTTLDQLMAISDAGAIMPPKSTWFEPKLRDAMVCHDF